MYKFYLNKIIIFSRLIISLIFIITCRQVYEPIDNNGELSITAETIAASFVRFKLEITSKLQYNGFEITSGDSVLIHSNISGRDTVLFINNLEPETSYRFQAKLLKKGIEIDTSIVIDVMTASLSSRDFSWTVDTLGDYGSILHDVAIISDSEVWVVGKLTRPDHSSQNLAIWDGNKWKIDHIPLITVYGDTSRSELTAIYKLDKNNVFVISSNAGFGYYNGITWKSYNIPVSLWKGTIKAIWASSSTNVYMVGNGGGIIHFDGSKFKALNSHTNEDLAEITGFVDSNTGKMRIWAGGTFNMVYCDDGENWQVLWDEAHPLFEDNLVHVHGLYIPDERNIIASVWSGVKGRLYVFDQDNFHINTMLAEHKAYDFDIAGQNIDDIFSVASYNIVEHYNGSSIFSYSEFIGEAYNLGADYQNNSVYIAGITGSSYQGIVIRGTK